MVSSAAASTLLPASVFASQSPLTASIRVDVARVRHPIHPNIYGSFIEHIGRIIYGGIYEEGSPLSDENSFRKDVLNAARDWGVTNLRWPGGNFASGYHWQDGIGPKAARPRRYDLSWFQEESNHFGTDEYVEYCRKVGAEPHICVNLGTGTIEEAANWVEYCNGTGNKHDLWRRDGGGPVEERYNLRDALWVASVLNLFQRTADRVTMANIAQLVNSIGTIFTSPNAMFMQTIFFPLKLYRQQGGSLVLRSDVESPEFSSKSFKNVPYLDVSATLAETRKAVSVAVVNRHQAEPIQTTLAVHNARLASQATAFEINGASPDTENSFSEPENVKINQKPVSQIGEKFSYTFPAHSVTLLKMSIA